MSVDFLLISWRAVATTGIMHASGELAVKRKEARPSPVESLAPVGWAASWADSLADLVTDGVLQLRFLLFRLLERNDLARARSRPHPKIEGR